MARQELDVQDMKRRRTLKRLGRLIKKILLVLLIAAVGGLLWLTQDRWLPFLDGIVSRYSTSLSQNTGELAQGNFPLDLASGSYYQTAALGNALTVINDTHLYVYSTDGSVASEWQHKYSSPVLHTNGRKILLYDQGGRQFQVGTSYRMSYEKKLEDIIILARQSKGDYTAVVTKSDQYVSVVTVYDGTGSEIYILKNTEDRILDVSFTPGNDGILVTSFNVSGGQMVSKLTRYRLGEAAPVWETQTLPTLAVSAEFLSNGSIAVIGDTLCALYSRDGALLSTYAYPWTLLDYDCDGSTIALLFQTKERRQGTLAILQSSGISTNGGTGMTPVEISLEGACKEVTVSGDTVQVMTTREIAAYSTMGTRLAEVEVRDEYASFHRIGGYIFLIGYSSIDRIDFTS